MSKKAAARANFPGQQAGEEVMMVIHQHPLVMRKALIWGLVAILVGVLPLNVIFDGPYYGWLVLLAFVVPLFVFAAWFYRWVGWYYTMYIVTNLRILDIRQKGFFNRRVNETQIDKILNLNYHIKGFQAVLFSYGDINIENVNGQVLKLPIIHKPTKIHAELAEVVKRYGGNPRHYTEDQVA